MDNVKLVTIGNRVYRQYATNFTVETKHLDRSVIDKFKKSTLDEDVIDMDEIDDKKRQIIETIYHVDPKFHRFIIGKGGKTKSILESETQTKIVVPGPNSMSTEIGIVNIFSI